MFNNMQTFNSVVYPIANAYTVSMYYYANTFTNIMQITFTFANYTYRIWSYNDDNRYIYNLLGCTYTSKLSGASL